MQIHGPIHAVTFDFHATLVDGESWLDLEIRTLPAAILRHLVATGQLPAATATPALLAAAETRYRTLRQAAMASGQEVDAVAGVTRVLAALGLTGDLTGAVIESAVEVAQQACLADTAPVPGAHAAVAAVAARGWGRAVVSSAAYPPFVEWGLARHGLADLFPVVATSAATGYYKSDPRLYHWALDRLGVAPAHAVHVGDHPRWDVQGAQAAGLRAVWLDRGPSLRHPLTTPEPPDTRPDAVITSMAELAAVLDRLAGA